MRSKGESSMVMIDHYTDEIIQDLFDSLLCKYQMGLKQSIKGDFNWELIS